MKRYITWCLIAVQCIFGMSRVLADDYMSIVFEAKTAVCGTQGNQQWYYMYRKGDKYALMPKYSQKVTPTWRTCDDYPYVDSSFFFPSNSSDAVKKWVSNDLGPVDITGDVGPVQAGSDGVIASIYLNATLLWSSKVTNTAVTPQNVTGINVIPGDEIYFVINKNGNMRKDKVRWEPVITQQKRLTEMSTDLQNAVDLSGVYKHVSAQEGTYIDNLDQGDYFKLPCINFSDGFKTLQVRLAAIGTGAKFEVRRGRPTGDIISTFTVCSTGSWDVFEDQYASVDQSVKGLQDIYIVGKEGSGIANISKIKLLKSESRGATMPFTTLQAENALCSTGAEILDTTTDPAPYVDNNGRNYTDRQKAVQSASGKSFVLLDGIGEYVEFTAPVDANKILLRFTIPRGSTGTISFYKNNIHTKDIALDSTYCFDTDTFYMRSFDEVYFDVDVKKGDKLKFVKDTDDSCSYCGIDLIDLELSGAEDTIPQGYISITDYGANGTDSNDDTQAIRNALAAAKLQGKHVWFPKGRFIQNDKIEIPDGVNIKGAGIWYTELYCPKTAPNKNPWGGYIGFYLNSNTTISNMMITGNSKFRDDQGIAIMGKNENLGTNCVIDNVWFRNMTTAMGWTGWSYSQIINCRFRGLYADAIHFGDWPQQYNLAQNNHIRGCGDDGIAVVMRTDFSNQKGKIGTDLVARFNTIDAEYWGRGMSIIGGCNVVFSDNIVDSIFNGGIMIATEWLSSPAMPIINAKIQRNSVIKASHDKFGHGGIHFWLDRNYMKDVKIELNTICDGSTYGIAISAANYGDELGRTKIYSNKVYNNKYGSYINGDPSKVQPDIKNNDGINNN